MSKKLSVGNALIGEYVAQGANHKHTIVNSYSGDIIISDFPAEINLGLYIELFNHLKNKNLDVSVNINIGGETMINANVSLPIRATASVVILPNFHVRFEEESRMEVVIESAGYENKVAISKRVFKGPVA